MYVYTVLCGLNFYRSEVESVGIRSEVVPRLFITFGFCRLLKEIGEGDLRKEKRKQAVFVDVRVEAVRLMALGICIIEAKETISKLGFPQISRNFFTTLVSGKSFGGVILM